MTPHSSLLSDYTADVERFFDEQSSTIINNKDREHASVLISTLFKKSKEEIYVFSRKLDGDFYTRESIRNELVAAVERGVKLNILVQETPAAMHLVQELTHGEHAKKVKVKKCSPTSFGATSPINFTVVDKKAYRLERDRDSCEAFACANAPVTAQKLIDLYKSFELENESVV